MICRHSESAVEETLTYRLSLSRLYQSIFDSLLKFVPYSFDVAFISKRKHHNDSVTLWEP
jgi:hypothetical protein